MIFLRSIFESKIFFMGICFLIIVLLAIIFLGLGVNSLKNIYPFLIWILIISIVSATGIFISPIIFVLVLIGTIIVSFIFYSQYNKLPNSTNIFFLTSIHLLRIPMEFILYSLWINKLVPREMTYEGLNFDLYFGISTILILIVGLIWKDFYKSNIFRFWNFLGICFLLNVLIIGIISSPLPLQLIAHKNPNLAVLQFPYSLLPAVVVPVIILAHILSLRNYLKR